MNEIDPKEELRYRRTMETYMRLQNGRLRIFYFGIYTKVFLALLVIAAGCFAYFFPNIVEGWWNNIVDYVERWLGINFNISL